MDQWITLLFVSGLILLLLEIFIIPGLGVTGILGVGCLLVSIYFIADRHGPLMAFAAFFGSVVFVSLALYIFFRSPASKWVVLDEQTTSKNQDEALAELGDIGVTVTPLYPTGKALISRSHGKKQLDVITDGEFIEKDQEVRIVRIEGNRIFVNLST